MPDIIDQVQELQLATLARQIASARFRVTGPAAFTCQECGTPIPPARRTALPGVQYCIHCQQFRERHDHHYHKGL